MKVHAHIAVCSCATHAKDTVLQQHHTKMLMTFLHAAGQTFMLQYVCDANLVLANFSLPQFLY